MTYLTKPQRRALHQLFARSGESTRMSYRAFRRTVHPGFGGSYIMVPFCGMQVGIEQDGYTHS